MRTLGGVLVGIGILVAWLGWTGKLTGTVAILTGHSPSADETLNFNPEVPGKVATSVTKPPKTSYGTKPGQTSPLANPSRVHF